MTQELSDYRLKAMEENIELILEEIKEMKKNYVTKEMYSKDLERIKHIENIIEWAAKIVIGAVILAILSLVIISK